jgi:hypothetical protein
MFENGPATKTRYVLHQGARVCFLLAVLLLLLAGYLLLAPIDVPVQGQPMFRCGSAAQPPGGDLSKSVCGRINQDRQLRVGFVTGAALVTAVGGLLVFGGSRRPVENAQPAGPAAPDPEPNGPAPDDWAPVYRAPGDGEPD